MRPPLLITILAGLGGCDLFGGDYIETTVCIYSDEGTCPAAEDVDRKEAFNIGLELAPDDPRMSEPFRGANMWPDLPGFRETTLAYFDAVHRLGVALHRPIALDLGLNENYFDSSLDSPLATLRMLRYPGGPATAGEIGAGAHTDYGSVTLLMGDGEPGL